MLLELAYRVVGRVLRQHVVVGRRIDVAPERRRWNEVGFGAMG